METMGPPTIFYKLTFVCPLLKGAMALQRTESEIATRVASLPTRSRCRFEMEK